jgi:ATP-dependent metalloprotease
MGNDWTEESRRKIAYLEVGHALVAFYNALPVHMASTVPTLGLASHKQMLAKLDALMGGRVAEEEIFGKSKVTFGACSTNLSQATSFAREIVTQYGMSTKIGLVTHTDDVTMSQETRAVIETEVKLFKIPQSHWKIYFDSVCYLFKP